MVHSRHLRKKGIGVSLENGLLTAFYWKRKGSSIKIIDSVFLPSLVVDESATLSLGDHQKLTEFLQQYGSRSDEVIVEIPRDIVLVRHLKLPALSDQDLEQMLNYEVERHVPFSRPDIYYDWQTISRNEKEAQVLLVVAKKQLVDACLDLVKTDKVKLTAVLVSSFSLLNLLIVQHPAKVGVTGLSSLSQVGVVSITSHYVEISFIFRGNLEGSFTIPIKEKPWQDLFREVEVRGPDSHVVGTQSIRPLHPGETYDYLIQSFTKWLVLEVGKSFLKQEFMGKGRVEKLILLQPRLPNLELGQPFRQHLGIPVDVIDFSVTIKTKKNPQAALLRSKAGLALKDAESEYFKIDLFPRSLAAPKPPKLYLTATLLVILFLLLGTIYFGRFFKEKAHLLQVQEQLVSLEPQVKSVTEMRNKLKALKDQTETLVNIENQGPGMLEILKELTLKTPEYAWLRNIKVSENKVDIEGYSNHSKGGQASDLIRLFSDSIFFEKPSFAGPIQTIGRDTETFRMTMEIRKSRWQQNSLEKRNSEKPGGDIEQDGIPDRETTHIPLGQKTMHSSIEPVTPSLSADRQAFQPKVALEENFGNKLSLQGYDLSHKQIGRGDTFQISYYWKLSTQLEDKYAVFVHIIQIHKNFYEKLVYKLKKKIGLVPLNFFQQDHFLLEKVPSPWPIGEILKENYQVKVPENLEPGTYGVWVGVWNPEHKERLFTKKGNKVKIAQIEIL